jgi:hypothetical protein
MALFRFEIPANAFSGFGDVGVVAIAKFQIAAAMI